MPAPLTKLESVEDEEEVMEEEEEEQEEVQEAPAFHMLEPSWHDLHCWHVHLVARVAMFRRQDQSPRLCVRLCAQVSDRAFRCVRVSQPCIPVSNRAFTCDSGATDGSAVARFRWTFAHTERRCRLQVFVATLSELFCDGSALQQDHFICRS